MHPHKSNTSNGDKPEVLISSVPTNVSRLRGNKCSNARKGAVNIASLEKAAKCETV